MEKETHTPEIIPTLQLLETFPQARGYVKRKYKEVKRELKQRIISLENNIQRIELEYTGNERWFYTTLHTTAAMPRIDFLKGEVSRFRLMLLKEETEKKGGTFEAIDVETIRRTNLIHIIRNMGFKTDTKGWMNCPFHNEKTPSFSVYEKNGVYKFNCFGCGEHGDALDFVMKTQGVSFKEAANRLQRII